MKTPSIVTSEPRSLLRILGIFEVLAHRAGGVTLAELSAALEAPKSSLLLLLRPLVAHKYLVHASGRYELGASIFKLSAEVLASAGITRILRPYIEQLAARCEESVFLALIDKEAKTVTYVDGIDSRQAIRYSVPIGTQRPLHVSAAGKVLFAFQDLAWQKKYLKTVKLKPMTSKPLPDRAAFEVQLQEIREAGVAVSIGEAVAGASGIAAPVVKADGTASYAFMIAAPSDRFVQSLPALRNLLLEVAGEASATLRHMPGG
ncbi:transcriptional regulator, IclR family, C-terminal domain protein [Bordetella bronchiseptica E014]|uniref:IclR family transcriptional regulator n=1 Tax=Bordetella bronchiseptica TaxID=518 RepID=UPI00045B6B2C|nr:IclR family transcriptional regulator [Bordetella bronchiseptica]KCV29416.1 transcriptional regulator, IclR family, C-terminal domain protein [Bordetella bronchiseptica 00-P-2730]KDD55634.1 transcriptional regulator, IclR family, C-terminal domain protein [Bordetella bronchiseptica OSU553]AWQ07664.1 transcriptional regulator [Bordetella bronchiseptica]AZW33099.1 IclR family transcriptional regulator [Bordetella bronchiseptica]KCV44579.1 transcriptional regulator, IclR family, C-terminal dom